MKAKTVYLRYCSQEAAILSTPYLLGRMSECIETFSPEELRVNLGESGEIQIIVLFRNAACDLHLQEFLADVIRKMQTGILLRARVLDSEPLMLLTEIEQEVMPMHDAPARMSLSA